MRLILAMVQSADGKIAKHDNHLPSDWNSEEDRRYFRQLTLKHKAVIMGRKTFQTLEKPLKDRFTLILSSTPEKFRNSDGIVEFTGLAPREALKYLESKGFKEAVLAGGSITNRSFINENLVDELHLTVEGIIFGRGSGICDGIDCETLLEMTDVRQISSNSILIRYKILNKLSG